MIPSRASARFNIRFNDMWTADSVKQEIERRLDKAAKDVEMRPEVNGVPRQPVDYSITYTERPSHVFLTSDDKLIKSLSSAISDIIGSTPELSTGGGTSDARFIKDVCPVVEFGLVGQTMHQVDERTELADLDLLTDIYERFIVKFMDGETV